jgi:hypothetical protein
MSERYYAASVGGYSTLLPTGLRGARRTWYVYDRVYCCRIVAEFGEKLGAEVEARRFARCLNADERAWERREGPYAEG